MTKQHQSYGANVYSPTKYAQRGLAENLRWELLPCNIHMHVVCPRFVDTPMLQGTYLISCFDWPDSEVTCIAVL